MTRGHSDQRFDDDAWPDGALKGENRRKGNSSKANGSAPEVGATLLDDVHVFLCRFISYPSDDAGIAHVLWVAHAHLMEAWESTPRIAFLSPEPASGKTRAIEITELLVPRPVEAINVTPAYLFRKVGDKDGAPTILFDEIDTIFGPKAKEHEEIRGLLNAGHRRGAVAGRCVVRGRTIETEEIQAYCAVALAGLGSLPDTLLSRSVIIHMRRRAPHEVVEPYRRRFHSREGEVLRERLAAWAREVARRAADAVPSIPGGVEDRDADVWEPLLAVADIASGTWPKVARVSCVSLVSLSKGNRHSLGVRLLIDLRVVFRDKDTMLTKDILEGLCSLDESPWADLRGNPLSARKLATFLKPYEVASKQVRVGDLGGKGYVREDFYDAWSRYAPSDVGSSPLERETRETWETDLFDAGAPECPS